MPTITIRQQIIDILTEYFGAKYSSLIADAADDIVKLISAEIDGLIS